MQRFFFLREMETNYGLLSKFKEGEKKSLNVVHKNEIGSYITWTVWLPRSLDRPFLKTEL